MNSAEMLQMVRKDNPKIRYALRIEPHANGGAVLGAWCRNAGGFIPVALETRAGSGRWESMPVGYLEIDGVAVGIDPSLWLEN